jgi:hypothetical protein
MYQISPQGQIRKTAEVPLATELEFSSDFTAVRVAGPWPKVLLDDSAPLSPATDSLTIILKEATPGRFEPSTGHMELPILLHLDYRNDFPLGTRDQDVHMQLSTRARLRTGSPGARLWEQPPSISLGAEMDYTTREVFLGSSQLHTLTVILFGAVDPLPPRP